MKAIFVLIMIAYGGERIPSIQTHEFSSLKACEMAKSEFMEMKTAKDAICVEK